MSKKPALLIFALASLMLAVPAGAITNGAPDGGEHPYVGQLFLYVPDDVDDRFDDPGSWYNCSGTLVSPTIVITAGHCTYAIGDDGTSTTDGRGDGSGGNDVWLNFAEVPNYDGLPPSASYERDENQERYEDWVDWLATQPAWHRGTAYPHLDYDNDAFFLADLGVVVLDEPVRRSVYGELPELRQLNPYQTQPRNERRFTAVGYGLEKVLPIATAGGDTRRTANMMLVTLKGQIPGFDGTWAVFSANRGRTHRGGTCFGDSGGPVLEAGTDTVVAVVSWGTSPNCTDNTYAYRIDQADDLNWLEDTFGVTT